MSVYKRVAKIRAKSGRSKLSLSEIKVISDKIRKNMDERSNLVRA
jgi:hypothetical protein